MKHIKRAFLWASFLTFLSSGALAEDSLFSASLTLPSSAEADETITVTVSLTLQPTDFQLTVTSDSQTEELTPLWSADGLIAMASYTPAGDGTYIFSVVARYQDDSSDLYAETNSTLEVGDSYAEEEIETGCDSRVGFAALLLIIPVMVLQRYPFKSKRV
ncbi:MAG: hypothetical protein LBQ42_02375 [Synergistaceae bacterium]|nr:hypothetical protein [Synergistaceae bacterium]